MTRRRALAAAVRHVALWPLPAAGEPQLDPDAHPWIGWLCWLRQGRRRWSVALLWLGCALTTAGVLLYLPILRDHAPVPLDGAA